MSRSSLLLLDHLMYIQRPDGTTPFFGDDDGGRLMILDQRAANDFRAPLSTGAALFGRGDYKYGSGEAAEETLWLLGPNALLELDRLPAHKPVSQSIAFPQGGYYVMRDGWTPTANYLLFDCGPHGQDNCGHAHADALEFELAAHASASARRSRHLYLHRHPGRFETGFAARLRITRSPLMASLHRSRTALFPGSRSLVPRQQWINRERFDYVEGKHDGYLRLAAPVTHARSILFLKNDYWIVRDRVTSSAEHLYALWFHLNADLNGRVDAEQALVISEVSDEASLPPSGATLGTPALNLCICR